MTDQEDPPLRTVLVVDDDDVDREAVKRLLKASFNIIEAGDGASGMARLEEHRVDCLLLDYLLPDTDGVSFVQRLREQPKGRMLPVVMLTGQGDEKVAVEALKAGAADYLPKRALTRSAVVRAVENAVEKVALQDAVDRYRNEIESKNLALARSNEALLQKNDEIKGFYQQLSHELKTPLTSNQAFLSLLLDGTGGELSDEQREYLEYALKACKQMTHCVNDILDVSRLNTGKMDFHPEPGDITKLVRDTVSALTPSAEKVNVAIECSVEDGLPPALMHEKRIVQVINNLVGNALKFTPPEGAVSVSVSLSAEDEDQLCVTVVDTGKGMQPDELERIFERLYQVGSGSTGFFSGMGLGLHISREIVRMHGGRIHVSSTPGAGSSFSFTIPTSQPHVNSLAS